MIKGRKRTYEPILEGMEEQKAMEQTNSGSDAPQFYEVVVMDSKQQDVLDTSSDGITVTLKDSTTDEDLPVSVSTREGILVPQNVVSQGEIQIAELQTTEAREVAVVYTSSNDVPHIQYVTQTAPSVTNIGETLPHKIVVQGEEGKQQIVISEVQTLPQDIQATILNTIEEMKTNKMDDNVQEVPDTVEITEEDPMSRIVSHKAVVHSESNISSVSGITTCARNDQPLDDMVPPQILATEDENTGPDDIPMDTNDGQLITQTVTSSVDGVDEDGLTQSASLPQENTNLPSSEEDKVIDGTSLIEESVSEDKAEDQQKETDEVNMAKFAPLILAPSKSKSSPSISTSVPMDKPRIVSISHGTAGSASNGQMDVPNFMDGTDGDDISNQEGLSLVQGGAAILTSVDDVAVSEGYVISPSVSSARTEGSGKTQSNIDNNLKDSSEFFLEGSESKEPKSDAKKSDGASTGKSTPDGKSKGKKGKNEMLHGMQLLSECAMRLENQDGGPEEEGDADGTSKEVEVEAQPEEKEKEEEEKQDEVNVEEITEEEAVGDVTVEIKNEPEESSEVTEIDKAQLQEVELQIQPVSTEANDFVTEPILENTSQVQSTTEVVVTTQGQVLKAVSGSNIVSVPIEIGNNQEVVMDSQQISEELIPMVQEEVILEIVEGDQIVVNNSGVHTGALVNDLYGGQTIGGDKTYLPVQGLAPSLMQQGNLPSSHRIQTYSQELKSEKKRSRKRATKHKNDDTPQRSRKRAKTTSVPSSSGESSRQKYQCHVCQKLFEKMKELRDHLLVHYNTKGYVCDFCNKTFSSSSHLRRHVMIHTGERPHKCDFCGEGFIQAVQLRVHKHRHGHGPPPPLSRAPPRSKKKGKKHKPTKTDKGQKYQCPVCKVKHKSKKKIKTHMKTHSNMKTFKCKDCNEVFRNKNQLTIHEGRHKGKPELQCSYCGKVFDTSSHMKRHERIHTGEKPYKCQFCDKSFIQGVQLRLHERIHTGERPHVCTYCGKAFARTQYLKRHSCIHTGEKPLQCRFCPERFIQPVQRQQHEKKLHKKKLKKLLAQKQKPGQPPIKLVLRLKKKKGRKGQEVTDSDDSDSDSSSSVTNDSN